ncbi:hypothetical protein M885DRAFT_625382 [Pelagophyceae sp. CCMP2097]|nr:hypothetical protein M885DRAFT_625382 [Pelagophyceae sp. CCMP2097]
MGGPREALDAVFAFEGTLVAQRVDAYVAVVAAACASSAVAHAVLRDPIVSAGRAAVLWRCHARARAVVPSLDAETRRAVAIACDDVRVAARLCEDAAEIVLAAGGSGAAPASFALFHRVCGLARDDAAAADDDDAVAAELRRVLVGFDCGRVDVADGDRPWALRGAALILDQVCLSAPQFVSSRLWRTGCWRQWRAHLEDPGAEAGGAAGRRRASALKEALVRVAHHAAAAPRAPRIGLQRALHKATCDALENRDALVMRAVAAGLRRRGGLWRVAEWCDAADVARFEARLATHDCAGDGELAAARTALAAACAAAHEAPRRGRPHAGDALMQRPAAAVAALLTATSGDAAAGSGSAAAGSDDAMDVDVDAGAVDACAAEAAVRRQIALHQSNRAFCTRAVTRTDALRQRTLASLPELLVSVADAVWAVRTFGQGGEDVAALAAALVALRKSLAPKGDAAVSSAAARSSALEDVAPALEAVSPPTATSGAAAVACAAAALEACATVPAARKSRLVRWAAAVLFAAAADGGDLALAAAAPALAACFRAGALAAELKGLISAATGALRLDDADDAASKAAATGTAWNKTACSRFALDALQRSLGAFAALRAAPHDLADYHLYGAGQLVKLWASGRAGAGLAYGALRCDRTGHVRARLRDVVRAAAFDDAAAPQTAATAAWAGGRGPRHEELRTLVREASTAAGVVHGLALLVWAEPPPQRPAGGPPDAAARRAPPPPPTHEEALRHLASASLPSLVVHLDAATLGVVVNGRLEILSTRLERALAEVLLIPAAAGGSEAASARHAEFVSNKFGHLFSTGLPGEAPKTFDELVRLHLDGVTCLIVAELGGDRSDAAKRALAEVERVRRRDPRNAPDRAAKRPRGADAEPCADDAALVASLLSSKLLQMITKVVHVGWARSSTDDKARRLRALGACLEALDAAEASRFAPNVLATLVAASDEAGAPELVAVGVDALCRYVRRLPADALRAHVGLIVAALVPSLEDDAAHRDGVDGGAPDRAASADDAHRRAAMRRASEKRASELVRWLTVDQYAALAPAFHTVARPPPTSQALRDVRAALARADAEARPGAAADAADSPAALGRDLARLAPLIAGDSALTQLAALRALTATLEAADPAALAALVDGGDAAVARLAQALMRLASRCRETRLRLALATAVGELGALDPARLRLELGGPAGDAAAAAAAPEPDVPPAKRRSSGAVPVSDDVDDLHELDTLDDAAAQARRLANGAGAAFTDLAPWRLPFDEFAALVAVKFVVPAASERKSHRSQDHASYSLQELLKLLSAAPAPATAEAPTSGRKRRSVADKAAADRVAADRADGSRQLSPMARAAFERHGCLDVVLPYLHTEYVVTDSLHLPHAAPPARPAADGGADGGPAPAKPPPHWPFVHAHAQSHKRWLRLWVRRLSFEGSSTFADVFRACRVLSSCDERLAQALLPYVVAEALCNGDAALVVDELEAVLARPEAVDAVILQVVFSLFATLEAWHADAAQLEKRMPATGLAHAMFKATPCAAATTSLRRLAVEFGAHGPGETAAGGPAHRRLALALDALPLKTLARAATLCGAHARAALYHERAVRNEALCVRAKEHRGTRYTDCANGYVPRLEAPDDVDALQKVGAELDDDPDYLAGVAARRRCAGLAPTLPQRIREQERDAQWREALHGHEDSLRGGRTLPGEAGVIRCLVRLGHLESAVVHAEHAFSAHGGAGGDDWHRELTPLAAEACWRLGRWDKLRTLLGEGDLGEGSGAHDDAAGRPPVAGAADAGPAAASISPASPRTGGDGASGLLLSDSRKLSLARCVSALRGVVAARGRPALVALGRFRGELSRAKLAAMDGLSAASMESYARAYVWVAQLHLLREVEHCQLAHAQAAADDAAAALRDGGDAVDGGDADLGLAEARFHAAGWALKWEARLRSLPASGAATECLAVRRCCLELLRMPGLAAECAVRAAKLYRADGRADIAKLELGEAARLGACVLRQRLGDGADDDGGAPAGGDPAGDGFSAPWLASQLDFDIKLAEAQLAAQLASPLVAYTMLEPVELNFARVRLEFNICGGSGSNAANGAVNAAFDVDIATYDAAARGAAADDAPRRLFAQQLLVATEYMVDARLRHGADVVKRFELAVALRPCWEQAYVAGAKYFDLMLNARKAQLRESSGYVNSADPPAGADARDAARGDDDAACDAACYDVVCQAHAKEAMRWYARALECSAVHAADAVARLLTLTFEYAALPRDGASEALNALQQETVRLLKRAMEHVPASVWYTAVPQLVSRAGHPSSDIRRCVIEILCRVVVAHPHRALWLVCGLALSSLAARAQVGERILAKARLGLDAEARALVDAATRLFKDLAALARYAPNESTRTVDLKKVVSDRDASKMIMPTRAAMTAALVTERAPADARPAGARGGAPAPRGEGRRWPRFRDGAPKILSLSRYADVLHSKARPKKLSVNLTDGTSDRLLCKREKDGDLRKDARVNDFNECVNRLLQQRADARARKLRLRTYAVVILDEECGLCEWVRDTHGLRYVIEKAYSIQCASAAAAQQSDGKGAAPAPKAFVPFYDERLQKKFHAVQSDYARDAEAMALAYRRDVAAQYAPCLSRWFERRFGAEPAAWFEARARFCTSAACWGAVGHVVGLGDRHGENVLVDVRRGECVHVDFDCVFDKGCALRRPEVVPFRLTPHMVEAFGVTGIEGLFRRSLEVVLATAREQPRHRTTLLNVLEPFLRDPTVGWTRSGKAQRDDGAGKAGRRAPPAAEAAKGRRDGDPNATLETVSQRLEGIYNLPVPPPPGSAKERDERAAQRAHARGGAGGAAGGGAVLELALSVPGHVERLIKEATDDTNLCRMYIGWTPFL